MQSLRHAVKVIALVACLAGCGPAVLPHRGGALQEVNAGLRRQMERLDRVRTRGGEGLPRGLSQQLLAPVADEVRVEDKTERSSAELNGGSLGLAVWRDDEGAAHVATLGAYNRLRYWSVIERLKVRGRLPEKILIADRFIPGDSDLTALKEGIAGLRRLGINVLMTGPNRLNRELAWKAGFRKVTWGVYNPPGYAFDFGGDNTSEVAVRNWAAGLREQYTRAGFKATDFAMYIISDEPGFYYPSMYRTVNENPIYLARFHEYLRQQNLKPQDFGAESWDQVKLIGRSAADTACRAW